jgi:hypothetical protein
MFTITIYTIYVLYIMYGGSKNSYILYISYISYMEDRITVSIYRADKERLKKYFTDPDLSYADVVRYVLDMLESKQDIKPSSQEESKAPVPVSAAPAEVTRKIAKKAPTEMKRGGARKPVTDEVKAEVRRLKASTPDISNRKIAEMVMISPAMVNNILNEGKEDLAS